MGLYYYTYTAEGSDRRRAIFSGLRWGAWAINQGVLRCSRGAHAGQELRRVRSIQGVWALTPGQSGA